MSDLDKLITQARRAGWRVEKTRGGHWKFWSPDGKHAVVSSSTPSDRRSMSNLRAQLKRAGYKPLAGRPRKAPKPAAPPPPLTPGWTPAAPYAPGDVVEAPIPPAPEPTELDQDLAAVDRFLDHLATFSQIVSKYRAKLAKLREIEQVLK